MKTPKLLSLVFVLTLWGSLSPIQEANGITPIFRADFDQSTLEESGWLAIPNGQGEFELASVSIGTIPTEPGDASYTDGRGVIVAAEPGQGALVLGPVVEIGDDPVIIRVSVRASSGGAILAHGALDVPSGGSIMDVDNSGNFFFDADSASVVEGYQRFTTVYRAKRGAIIPLFQAAVDSSNSDSGVTLFFDRFEVIPLNEQTISDPDLREALDIDAGASDSIPFSIWNSIALMRETRGISPLFREEYDQPTLDESGWLAIPNGQGEFDLATVLIGTVPTEPDDAPYTDGRGVIVAAEPGQGALVLGPVVETGDDPVIIRVSVRASSGGAILAHGALDVPSGGSIMDVDNSGNFFFDADSASVVEGYQRFTTVYRAKRGAIIPLFQAALDHAASVSQVTLFFDRFEVIPLNEETVTDPALRAALDIDSDAPVPTPTPLLPTPTPTEIPAPDPTPTPEPVAVLFFTDFENIDQIGAAGFITYDENNISTNERQSLINLGLLSPLNTLYPWFLYDERKDDPNFPTGVAKSGHQSAAFNSDFGQYYDFQTSILMISRPINTSGAAAPRISFDIAFDLEPAGARVNDFLTVMVRHAGQSTFEFIDLNSDGQIINDLEAVSDGPLTPGSFDGIFDSQLGAGEFELRRDHFVSVTADLPNDRAMLIAFVFESDASLSFFQGAFVDNVRVFDAAATGEPTIQSIDDVNDRPLYADSGALVQIRGENLEPVGQVIFSSRDGEIDIPFQSIGGRLTAIAPRLSDPASPATATIRVTRTDGAISNTVEIAFEAAPRPVITAIEPEIFPKRGLNTELTLRGDFFRPAFEGASVEEGSVLIFRQFEEEIEFTLPTDFIARSLNELSLDAAEIQQFELGPVQVIVRNEYSGLESEPFVFQLAESALVNFFDITVGGIGGYTFDPAVESFPLQKDHAFELYWEGENFSPVSLRVLINDATFVERGQVVQDLTGGDASVLIGPQGPNQTVILALAPMLDHLEPGEITVRISNGDGPAHENSFMLLPPQPPILYERDDDWSTVTLSASAQDNEARIVGDNFRGLTTGVARAESRSIVYLAPVDGSAPIALPEVSDFDISINPVLGDNDFDADVIFQSIPAGLIEVPEGETREFRLRVLNPDSGLSVTSSPDRVITFTP